MEGATRGPLISIIVVNWNGRGLLDECFASLAKQTWPTSSSITADPAEF